MKTMSCFALAAESATVQKSCTASSPARAAKRRQRSLRHAQNAPAAMAPNTMKPKKGDRETGVVGARTVPRPRGGRVRLGLGRRPGGSGRWFLDHPWAKATKKARSVLAAGWPPGFRRKAPRGRFHPPDVRDVLAERQV